MPEKIITLYAFFDDLLKAIHYKDDPQSQLTTAEIMTVAAVACEFFTGNYQKSLDFLVSHRYLKPFSKSRFNRRLHQIPETLWQFVLYVLSQLTKQTKTFLVDTFPVPVCRNIRIQRCKIYRDDDRERTAFRGYCASKKEYYYGLKVCLIVTEGGQPVEALFVPASTADIDALRNMYLNLPEGSVLIGDPGFLDRLFESDLKQEAGLHLLVARRKNMKEQLDILVADVIKSLRGQVETTFSQLTERLARSIHAVTAKGFELKVFLTILTFRIVG